MIHSQEGDGVRYPEEVAGVNCVPNLRTFNNYVTLGDRSVGGVRLLIGAGN